jgi:transcriptional regulator of arginine metabolism
VKNKNNRLQKIIEIIQTSRVGCQDVLLKLLQEKGFVVTQATLSRDLKRLKVAKIAGENGEYVYVLPSETTNNLPERKPAPMLTFAGGGVLSIEFSGNLAVIKTRPGYAGGIALDIDASQSPAFLGSIAGDDTILLIIRENISRAHVIEMLSAILPNVTTGVKNEIDTFTI